MDFLAATFRAKPLAHWMDYLAKLDLCYGPVNTLPEAIADPNLIKRETAHAAAGRPAHISAMRSFSI